MEAPPYHNHSVFDHLEQDNNRLPRYPSHAASLYNYSNHCNIAYTLLFSILSVPLLKELEYSLKSYLIRIAVYLIQLQQR